MQKLLIISLFVVLANSKGLNFEEILDLTLKNNKTLKSKELEIEVTNLELKKQQALDFGSIDLNQNFTYTDNAMYSFANSLSNREASFKNFGFSEFDVNNPKLLETKPKDLNYPNATKNFDTSINYNLNLFSGFQSTNLKKMAELKLKVSQFALKRDIELLSFEVLKSYNQSVANREFIKALEKAKEASESFITLSDALYKEGMVTKIDVLEAKDRKAQIDSKLIEAKNGFDISIAYLKFLSSNDSISDVDEFKYLLCREDNLENLQKKAIENRVDLKAIETQKEILNKKFEVEKGDFLPKVNLSLKYGFSEDSLKFKEDYYLVGTNINYNLFKGGSDELDLEIVKRDLQKNSLTIEQFKDKIKLDVESKYLNLLSLKKVIDEKQKSVELSSEVLQKAKEMYKNGLTSMSNLLLRESDLLRARAELIDATYRYTLAIADIKLSIGDKI